MLKKKWAIKPWKKKKTQRNLQCILLNEKKSQSGNATYCMTPTIWHFRKGKTLETVKRSVIAKDLAREEEWMDEAQRIFKAVKVLWGLPWWRSGWESACQCRGHGFEPWSGKISHAAEQLGLWATTTEPARLEPVLRNKRGHDSEGPAHRDEEWPPLAATRESPRTETKTQHSQK